MEVSQELRDIVAHALREDIGAGDVTSNATVPADRRAAGKFFARQAITLAGVELLPLIYEHEGGVEKLELHRHSGDALQPGDCIATVAGTARTLLSCERVSLNFMQRLSGIATLARRYAAEVEGTKCKVLDTRKTTPGLRQLEKMAAAAGGVVNHRMGLYDAVLIKNNHIAAAGGVTEALKSAFATFQGPIEIEVRTRAELDEALAAGAKHLLLDNLTPAEAEEWIHFINGRATVELSGNINLQTVRAYALTGADFVSCGAITHSATAVDINFRLTLGVTVPGWQVFWNAQTSSTMEDAARLIDQGITRDAIAGADEQTSGQGRHGRAWHSEPEAGLYVSFILKPRMELADVPIITLSLGLAVQEAIQRVADLAADLRWPNDVLIGGRKVAGILARLHAPSLIAGIGVNVNHTSMPPELRAIASSLRMVSNRLFDRSELLRQLARAITFYTELLENEGKEPILRLFAQQSSYVRGRRVTVDHESGSLRGTTDGLDPSGFLWLREEHGKRTLVRAGGVRPI